MNFDNVKRTNMSDLVINQIISKIIKGELKSGDKLPTEKELSELLNVGRSTVREALKSLEVLGLIIRKKTGTMVSQPENIDLVNLIQCFVVLSNIDLKRLMDLRIALEPYFIKDIIDNITEEDIKQLENLLEIESKSNSAEINIQFHQQLAKLSHNKMYQLVFEMLVPVLFNLQEITLEFEIALSKTNIKDHIEILNEIKNKNTEKASQLMKKHLQKLKNEF